MAQDLITRMDRWLAANRDGYHKALRPGTSEADLDAFADRFGLSLPDPFRALYRWRDGQSGYDSLQFNLMFAPLADVASTKEMLDGMIGEDFEDPKWWRRGWVPFLQNGGGDHWCLDLTAEDGGTPGQIRVFYHDEARRPIKHASFMDWLRALVETLESGRLKLS